MPTSERNTLNTKRKRLKRRSRRKTKGLGKRTETRESIAGGNLQI